MSANPIESISMLQGAPLSETAAMSPLAQQSSFSDWLVAGATRVDQTARLADDAVTRFALDGAVPPHQVMIALEEARMSLQFALQVRSRIVEGYQELMRMQM
ncbi:flagellar hook-basal body complex protein FliE [Burkholderia pyrrocinia]|uniref:flagellar hook-basal body complex protein FliE n=1 Tax=Burkholderia pyrrocinia TaxID=60550 RepID=UPI001BCACC2B|nr:flagellar hook-basal body complex protein FliE [Burkholderia pyrrocinia]QVN23641.1 flagellar hook-basal body complex protein FliE [Burkholderia pyrrocinia]